MSRSADESLLATLENQILGEVMAALAGQNIRQAMPVATVGQEEGDLAKALEVIESKLFEKFEAEDICAAARMSQATLFRRFKDALKTTPFAYIRGRRLDESLALLKTGKYQVSDAALLVGYEDLSAFSKAFKERFKKPPSTAIPRRW